MRAVSALAWGISSRGSALLLLSLAGCVVDWRLRSEDAATTDEMRGAGSTGEQDAAQEEPDVASQEQDAEADASSEELDASEPLDDAAQEAARDQAAADAQGADAAQRLAATASVDEPCALPLEPACTGRNSTQKLVCLGGKWTFDGSCDGRTRCDARFGITQGTCQPITTLCFDKRPGDAVCDAAARKRCGDDLLDEQPAPCPEHAHCDPAGGAVCACDSGFAADDQGNCQDIVDCPAGACAPSGVCVEGLNSYECRCAAGYAPNAAKTACVNVDDCPAGACANGTCVDLVGGYECSCNTGFRPNDGKQGCVSACTANVCAPGTCSEGPTGYVCSCPEFWYPAGPPADYCYYVDPNPCFPVSCV